MSLEDRISQSLDQGLARLDASPRDLAEVERRGRGVRRRRTVVGVTVAAVVAGVALVVPRLGDGDSVDPASPGGSWQQLPAPPLAPRADSVTAWTGDEALVVGGFLSLCPPTASCKGPDEMARDGAAYDPDAGTWRPIADAPVAMAGHFRSTMVGDTLVVFDGQRRWFAYDASDDAWRTLPTPRQDVVDMGSLTSGGGFVYVIGEPGPVLGLDVAEGRWVVLPDGLPGGVTPRTVVATPEGLVVSAEPSNQNPAFIVTFVWGYDFPTVMTHQLNPFRHWTGERLVELDLQTTDKLSASTVPYGGMLDPEAGSWAPLPDPPEDYGGTGWSPVAADGPLMAGWGYVYDDRDQSWTALERPEGAVAELSLSAVWADEQLLVFGGSDAESELVNQAWAWTR